MAVPHLPPPRVTSTMLNGNHHNDLSADAEVDVVWKSLEQRAPGVTMGNRKLKWRLNHGPKSC